MIPVACLPPEILGQVFVWLAASKTSRTGNKYAWLRTTRVCRHWREVALATSALWRTIVVGRSKDGDVASDSEDEEDSDYSESNKKVDDYLNLSRLQAFIMRSREASLDVVATCTGAKSLPALALIFPELRRANSFEFSFAGHTVHQLDPVMKLLPASSPTLRRLTILDDSYESPTNQGLSLSPFLAMCTPSSRLQKLSVTCCRVDWSGKFPKSLTELHISYKDCRLESPLKMVVAVVSALPALRSLELLDVFEPLPMAPSFPSHTVTVPLPHLERLALAGHSLSCVHFLNHLIFPESTSVSLSFLSGHPTDDAVLSSLLASMQHKVFAPHAGNRPSRAQKIVVVPACLDIFTDAVSDSAQPRLQIRSKILLDWGTVCAQLPLRSVTALSIGHYMGRWGCSWKDFLDTIPAVETLAMHAEYSRVGTLLNFLAQPPKPLPAQKKPDQYPLPKLKLIEIQEFRKAQFGEDILTPLAVLLEMRKRAGVPIHQLVMEDCGEISQKELNTLQKYAQVLLTNKC
ncbi:hypothetical protein EIP91_002238 [Steccherinum ochraceum]|uniref:F-box domain-containing protein n=1 Tax=Steccherinum ochraceum TaxID=92696 RepID=A0A4R0RT95_9APHY|nr:hypothetical protein EIP91_002238 [Steccherinum ochraceum]